jgi:hypothetical protein
VFCVWLSRQELAKKKFDDAVQLFFTAADYCQVKRSLWCLPPPPPAALVWWQHTLLSAPALPRPLL